MSPRPRLLLVVLALFAFALTSVAPGSAKTAKPTSASTLKTLQKLTSALPKTAASAKKRNQLRLAAAHARRVAARKPCAAVSDLTKYRKVLRGIKVKSGKRFRKLARQLAALQPVSMKASRLLLANRKTKSCGGGVSPSTVATTQTKLLQNDVNGMKLHVDLPDLNFVARTAGGK